MPRFEALAYVLSHFDALTHVVIRVSSAFIFQTVAGACYSVFVNRSSFKSVLNLRKAYIFKSVSMRKPGRTRQGVIMLKSPISLKLGTNVGYQELAYVTECQVKILNSLGDPGSPCKNRHFARLCIIN